MQIGFIINRKRVFTTAMRLAGLLVVYALVSCSTQSALPDDGLVAIAPLAALVKGSLDAQANSPLTKAPVDGAEQALTLYFVRADEAAKDNYGDYGMTVITAARTAGGGATELIFSPAQYYLTNGLKTKMTGWYPVATSFTGGVVSWAFDGSQDIMTAVPQQGTKSEQMPNLSFGHCLAQLQFFPYADNERITESWGKILKIEVLTQSDQAKYTPATQTVEFSGSTAFSARIATQGEAMASSKANAKMMGDAVMIAPQNSDSYVLTLQITTEKQGVKTVAMSRKFEAGIPYKIYLKFVQLEMIITPEISIGEWVAGYDTTVKTDPVTQPGIDVGDWGVGSDATVDY